MNDGTILIISIMHFAASFIANNLVDRVLVTGLGIMWLSLSLFN